MAFNTRSVTFDGTQKITCPATTPNLDASLPFTIFGVLKLDGDLAGWGGLVQKCTDADEGLELVANSRSLRLYMQHGAEVLDQQAGNVLTTDFNAFACSFDPSTQAVKMYINGTPVATTGPASTITGPVPNSALSVEIGKALIGTLNSLQIYQRVLTDAEVAALSTGATPTDPQTLDTSDDLVAQLDLGPKPDNKVTMHDTAGQATGTVSGSIVITTDVA